MKLRENLGAFIACTVLMFLGSSHCLASPVVPNGFTVELVAVNLGAIEDFAFDNAGALWVASGFRGNVTKIALNQSSALPIDGSTLSPAIVGLGAAFGVAFDHANNLFVPQFSNGTVAKIAAPILGGALPVDARLLPPLTSGLEFPDGAAFAPAGSPFGTNLFIGDVRRGGVFEIDPNNGAIRHFTAFSRDIEEVIFSQDGQTGYAISPGGRAVLKIQVGQSPQVLATGFAFPDAIVQGPGNAFGSALYLGDLTGNTLFRVDPMIGNRLAFAHLGAEFTGFEDIIFDQAGTMYILGFGRGGQILRISPTAAQAVPVPLLPGSISMFRDTRGLNDVGIAQGDRFQFGANIVGGSVGASVGAVYPPMGFTVPPIPCFPSTAAPNACNASTAFDANRLEPWTLRFEQPGVDPLEVTGPPLVLANGQSVRDPVPFPTNVTFSGSGVTPTITWQVPGGFTPDGFNVLIRDKDRLQPNGAADLIHAVPLPGNATSYTIPSTLSSGLSLVLGGHYSINLQMVETRNHVVFTGNPSTLRRASAFFAFSPVTGIVPHDVFLPTFVEGVYNFMIEGVGPTSITFIDPFVAVGYDYAIGAGDPNFASLLLPDVGDGQFTLAYLDRGTMVQTPLAHDVQFFFPQGGVSAFRVTDIEVAAGLDPNNVTAFITGLTFVTQGTFTGTMTPLTVFVPGPSQVPEPATLACVLVGTLGLAVVRWRQHRRAADV